MKVKNILISQPEPTDITKSPYGDLLKKYSINIDFYKFFRIEGVTSREFRDSKVNILDHSAIIFTSRNTIDQFFNLVKELRVQIPETMKYFCSTEPIAHYLQVHIQFRKRRIFYAKNHNSQGFNDLILKNKDLKFLIPCSADSNGSQLVDFIDLHNISYSQAVVFNTVAEDLQQYDISKYDMIVLFSPAGVQSLRSNFPNFKPNNKIALGALGNAAVKAIEAVGWKVDVIAPTPEAPSITAAMDIFLKDHATRKRQ